MLYTYNHYILLQETPAAPRPSEDPVWLFNYFKEHANPQAGDVILDIGCGQGVIALMLAKAYPHCHIHGLDTQQDLIQKSKENAKLNNLENCTFEQVNFLTASFSKKYNHVITNPPYHRIESGYQSQSNHKNIAHGATLGDMQIWLQKAMETTIQNGTTTFIQHMHNLNDLKDIFEKNPHHIQKIQNNPQKPAKKFMACIQKQTA